MQQTTIFVNNVCNNLLTYIFSSPPDKTIEHNPLQLVQISFDTATYDEIERDVKMTFTAQIGLIGETMGLLTGISILSGVEIVYYAVKFFMSLRITKTELAQKTKQVGTHLY